MGEFAKRLRSAMLSAGIKAIELHERTGISKATISEYLSGEYEPKQRNIYKLAEALHVAPSYLMGVSDHLHLESDGTSYYINQETARLAQALHDNPQYRVMFDSTRDMKPEDVQKVIDFIRWQRHQEGYDDD